MDAKEKFDLIKRNTQEILGEEELKKLIKSKKQVSFYWGTMPTGSISIAYFFPMMKVADFLRAGIKVKILIADLHAALDSVPWEELNKRVKYYKNAIELILKTIGVDMKKPEFVKGSELQLDKNYFEDLLKLSTVTSLHDSNKAASEGIKSASGEIIKLSGLIYPLMQALDEEYLKVDAQFAGMDQRKIMVYAREFLPKIGYKRRIELMNPIIRGLMGEKMSSSLEGTKIDLMDDEETVRRKMNKAECISGNPDNGIMALVKYLVFGVKSEFVIERPEKFGGNKIYKNYFSLEEGFKAKEVHPLDLKNSVAREINLLLKNFRESKTIKKLHKEAYPEFYKK
ncbi:MAG: tyrosine--tRNA ligase [Nanoarchaeota archaeon]|nr:tyrosine--tRNA ligase [Nanoarchaeota archaeon]